jgi:hypothetical protein
MLRSVFRLELTLLARGRSWWLVAPVAAALSAWMATEVRQSPPYAWSTIGANALFLTLLLVLPTGDQVARDRDSRLDGVLLSTPVPTGAYVAGKYLAALAVLVGLAGVGLGAALLMDRFGAMGRPSGLLGFLGATAYPPLGPVPYLLGWGWLVLPPLLFGAALTLAAITLARGQRVAAGILVLMLWLLPAFSASWPTLVNLPLLNQPYGQVDAAVDMLAERHRRQPPPRPEPGRPFDPYASLSEDFKARVGRAVREGMPPPFPPVFYANRALFLGLAAALVGLTSAAVARRRRDGS